MNKIIIGSTMIINRNIQTENGMLYSGSKVEIEDVKSEKNVRIQDEMGRIFYVHVKDLREYEI